TMFESYYSQTLKNWKEEGLRDDIILQEVITPSSFDFNENIGELTLENYGYESFISENNLPEPANFLVFEFDQSINGMQDVTMIVDIPEAGLYKIGLDFYSQTTSINPIELAIKINGETPFYEASQLIINTHWEST